MSIFLILYFVLQLFFRYFSQFPGYSHIFPVMNHFIICRIFRLACLPPWQYSACRFYCFAAQHFGGSDIFRVHILLSPVNYYNLYIYHLESSIFLSLLFRWSSGLFFFSCTSPPVHFSCLVHFSRLIFLSLRIFLPALLLSQLSVWLSFHHIRLFSLRFLSTSCFLPSAHPL